MGLFDAAAARQVAGSAIGVQLEETSEYFAKVLLDIRDAATNGCYSMSYNDASKFTVEMVCNLSSRGFVMKWIPDIIDTEPDGIYISWEAE